ncbi:hypothetical protein ACOMIC_15435, partial [Bacillus sp. YIM B13584]
GCAAKHYTYFIAGTEPADVCYGAEPSKKEKKHAPARKEAPRKKWWDKWLGKKD